jgi:hypothetical protein
VRAAARRASAPPCPLSVWPPPPSQTCAARATPSRSDELKLQYEALLKARGAAAPPKQPVVGSRVGGALWQEYGGANAKAGAPKPPPAADRPCAAVFVHFIPPPLRKEGKKDLPWIVHTCDGSGCREARHVAFHSVAGFSSFEGAPPEQAEGRACSCQIANHHLRGIGKVRWESDDAIVENDEAAEEDLVGQLHRSYRNEMRAQRDQLAAAQQEARRLREAMEKLSVQKEEAVGAELVAKRQLKEMAEAAAKAEAKGGGRGAPAAELSA